jgi:16S rRNA (uracil1498-N3)-methyltransferase
MPDYDFRSPRLYVEHPLALGGSVALEPAQAHYLRDVLRLKDGGRVLVFNGRDGEWDARLALAKRASALSVEQQTRPQGAPTDLHYVFAPLKAARLDYMVQKAVEMGASRLVPVVTRHGQVPRINPDRMRANAIEAAEQCGILAVAEVAPIVPLMRYLADREPGRYLVFCDEDAPVDDPVAALGAVPRGSPLAVMVGPEGGFAEEERAALLAASHVVRLALGPRILRADTAAVAALTLVGAVAGDWRA